MPTEIVSHNGRQEQCWSEHWGSGYFKQHHQGKDRRETNAQKGQTMKREWEASSKTVQSFHSH